VHLDRPAGGSDEAALLRDSIHEFFAHRADASRRRLKRLFQLGRTSLAIGVVFLTASILAGQFAADAIGGGRVPVRAEIRLLERLSAMPVRINYRGAGTPEAWRADWPAVPPHVEGPRRSE
jgi:hypothetical protein